MSKKGKWWKDVYLNDRRMRRRNKNVFVLEIDHFLVTNDSIVQRLTISNPSRSKWMIERIFFSFEITWAWWVISWRSWSFSSFRAFVIEVFSQGILKAGPSERWKSSNRLRGSLNKLDKIKPPERYSKTFRKAIIGDFGSERICSMSISMI